MSEKSFIRVSWPSLRPRHHPAEKTLENRHRLHRVCISMITHPRALEDTLFLIRRFREEVGLPISVLMNPTSMKTGDVAALREPGAQMAAVALDLAETPSSTGTGDGRRGDRTASIITGRCWRLRPRFSERTGPAVT